MYKSGDILMVKVTGIEEYGIFVLVDKEYSGLIHISEISDKFVRNITDYVTIDEEILALVIDCDEQEKRLKLSIKNLDYKLDGSINPDKEKGFSSLKEQLPIWIKNYKEENENNL